MGKSLFKKSGLLAVMIAGALVAHPAFADKPDWVGGGKGGKHERGSHERQFREVSKDRGKGKDYHEHDRRDREVRERAYFDSRHRVVVEHYYIEQFRSGRCPPGLAKKHNGCLPPGQAKKWAIGRPLPRDVRYYELPASVVVELGMPPGGYRYVRVANDILLMAIGTNMILDAITDLGGM